VLVAHSCNPSYSGDSTGESKFEASPRKQFSRPYLKKPFTKNRVGGVKEKKKLMGKRP
jgi:hypothetical protein